MSKNFLWASLLAVLILTSCASRKSFVYLQDMQMGTKYPIETKYEAVIHDDDRLSITVSSKNPELAIPFNINGGAVMFLPQLQAVPSRWAIVWMSTATLISPSLARYMYPA